MVALSSLVDIKGGGTPSKNKPEYWNGDIPWASVKDFKSSILSGASDCITQEGIDNSATNLIPKGNIIVPTRMALGKVAVNTVNLAINQDLKALIIKDEKKVDRDYLLRCIESKSVEIIRQGKGATVKGITLDVLKNLEIPLPPLETQKKIAAVLEKADQLRKDCQQMEQELNSLAQSVFIDMFGDPVTNSKGWEVKPLSSIVEDFAGGKSLVAADDESTIYKNKVLKISAVTSGEFKAKEVKPLPNEYEPPEEHFVKKDDLLFSRANTTELVGATTMLFDEYDHLVLPDKLWRFVWEDEESISPVFIWRLLCDAGMRRELSKLSSGSGGSMKNISKGKLKTLPVILPKLELQKKFEKVYMKLRSELEDNSEYSILSEQAFNSLMQKAFKGELSLKPSKIKLV